VGRDERPHPDEPQCAGGEHHQLPTQVRGLAEHDHHPGGDDGPHHRWTEEPPVPRQPVRAQADQVARRQDRQYFTNWPLPPNATPVPSQTAIQATTDPIQ
jgi:hypothetical protein